MRLYRLFFTLTFLFSILSLQASRPGAWRTERLPGSARLSMESLRFLVIPDGADDRLLAAVDDFQGVFELRYGHQLQLLTQSEARPKQAIYLERVDGANSLLADDTFLIQRERTQVVVSAAGDRGLLNGVYTLCGDLMGARWYWSGDLGFELVGETAVKFPEGHWLERPAYVMRTFYPMNTDFGRRNRLAGGYQFNHALAKVFSPELFQQEPEVFAEVGGHRYPPRGHGGTDVQPDFTEVRAVEIAAEAALAAFEADPELRSFSLSINDNTVFDDSEDTRVAVSPVEYFRSRPNYTDLVFNFMNQVARKVFDEAGVWTTPEGHPRYLTALAYFWTEQSPSFPIHARVMPVLTSDRAQWHDPEYRAQDKALIQRWADSGAERIATWDYYFGSPYPYPRQFNQWLAESLSFMSENGVDVFFSQLPSAWGMDGAKAWLAAELLWDPTQDANALLDEYYSNFFGAAGPAIRRFYEGAEAYRNANEGTAEWIKFYDDEFGVELFDVKIMKSLREELEVAKRLVEDDPRRLKRVEVVSEAFVYTEAFWQYHATRSQLVQTTLDVFEGVNDGGYLKSQLSDFLAARATFDTFARAMMALPMHARLKYFARIVKSDPVAFSLAAMAHSEISFDGAALDKYSGELEVAQLWANDASTFRSMASNVELLHAAGEPSVRNFLGPVVPEVSGWAIDFRPTEHLSIESAQPNRGLRVMGADMCSVYQDFPVIAGQSYLLDTTLKYNIGPDNRAQIRLQWMDSDGRSLGIKIPFRCPNGDSDGARRVVIPMRAPADAYTLRVNFYVTRQHGDDFFELERADFGLIAK